MAEHRTWLRRDRRANSMVRCAITLCAMLSAGAASHAARAQAAAPAEPQANPGRPTVSTPATLTPVGYLQFETGVLAANQSPEFSSRDGVNEVIKLSATPRLEFLGAAEPIDHYTSGGVSATAAADYFLGAQAVLVSGEGAAPTVAVSALHRVYDGGAPELDIGSPLNSGLLLVSADVLGFHYDANALVNEMTEGADHRGQFGQTLSVSHPIAGSVAISGELWHFTQPFLRRSAAGNLWALGYTASPLLVFDAGFNRGLTGTSTQWETFAGFTYLLPHRLWR